MKSPILGSSYVARSVNAADNRMVNLFPEIIPEGGKEPAFLQRAPGMSTFVTAGSGAIRGAIAVTYNGDEFLYVVSGDILYRISTAGAKTNIGNITGGLPSSTLPVSFAFDGDNVVVTTGASNNQLFVYEISTGTFTAGATNYVGRRTVTYLDGYFIFGGQSVTTGANKTIQCSNLLDPLTYDALAFAAVDASPDNVVNVTANNGELWVFGSDSTEVWSNVGGVPFPFAPIQGSFTETGCAAYASVAKLDNSLFWLGKDSRGQGIIYRTNGYRAERVSTHAVEWQIQNYSDISDAVAYTYQQDGHAFYVITFPTGNATWVYDVATQAWHERGAWDGVNFNRHIANCAAFFNGDTVVGCTDSLVNILSNDVYTEPGVTTRWLRSWRALPPGQNNLKRTAHHSLQIDCETGNDATGERTVELRWSDNGGHTYNSTPRTASLGAYLDYSKRVIFRRLGMTTELRDRVYELSGEDSAIFIMGAELMLSPTDA